MTSDLILLAKMRFRILINTIRYARKSGVYRFLFFATLGILFVLGDYSFFYRVVEYLKAEELIGTLLITQLLDMMSLTFFFMLIFSTVVAAISTLYLSSDLDLLVSSPLKPTAIFIVKFFQTTINSSWMVLLFGLPMFFALGAVFKKGIGFYLYMITIFVPFIFIAAGIGILFTVVLIKYFPAKRMQQVMTFMILLFISGIVTFFRFMKPETLYREVEMADNLVMAFFDKLSVPKSPYLPSSWLTSGLMSQIENSGGWLGILIDSPIMLMYSASLIVFIVVIITAKYSYFSGLSEAGTTTLRGKMKKWDPVESISKIFPVSTHQRALLVKDMKVFFRDTGQ